MLDLRFKTRQMYSIILLKNSYSREAHPRRRHRLTTPEIVRDWFKIVNLIFYSVKKSEGYYRTLYSMCMTALLACADLIPLLYEVVLWEEMVTRSVVRVLWGAWPRWGSELRRRVFLI